MSDRRNVEGRQVKPSPAWWVVCSRELRDLWIGGKALYLILIYTLLLGLYAFLLASNGEVNLISVKEVVAEMVRAAIAVGLFICLIIAADSFSGERERVTLEGLLLTPASRRQIVLGKFLAAVSPWPVALAIAIPYWVLMAKGQHHILWLGMTWGIVLGTLLAPGMVAFGMLISIWCNSNKTSMLVSICFYAALVLPTEIMAGPAKIQRTAEQWFRAEVNYWISPISAASRFLWKILVIGDEPAHLWMWHATPILLTVGAGGLLFLYVGPRVRLEAETAGRLRAFWERRRRVASVPVPQPVLSENGREGQAPLVPIPVQSHRMRTRASLDESQRKRSGSATGAWWLVFKKELRDLWFGGRAMYLMLVYTIVMGGYTYTMANDSVLSMIPPKEMVYEMLKAAMAACVFVGLIIGADSLSGERERSTLEGLLLTPTSRRQIVIGKFLAASSIWPVAFAITIPYMKILSQGDEVFAQALFWGPILGTILTPTFTALGMFVGFWCNSNKTSLFVSLCLYLLFMLPTTLLAHAQGGFMGQLVQWANPLGAPRNFLAGVMVNNWTMEKAASWLVSPVVFAAIIFVLLFLYASPGLRLEAGKASRFRRPLGSSVALPLIVILLTACLGIVPVMASEKDETRGAQPLQITIDKEAASVRAGTPILYNTVVTNTGKETTPPLIVAMNIINLKGDGEPVDPEDWSPQRTQYLEAVEPGKSATHSWRINAILDGNFMVYMVAIPAPGTPEATTQPVASSGIHLTVTPYTKLNPGGVLPYAIGGPILVGLAIFFVYRYRRRRTSEAIA